MIMYVYFVSWNKFQCIEKNMGIDMGGGTFFKVGAQMEIQKNIENFCGLNWQLWRHKHLNMTSLTFVRIFKQFYALFYKPSTTPNYRRVARNFHRG